MKANPVLACKKSAPRERGKIAPDVTKISSWCDKNRLLM